MQHILHSNLGMKLEEVLARYGCINIRQFPFFVKAEDITEHSEEMLSRAIQTLEFKRIITREGENITLANKKMDIKIIDSIWTMIDICSNSDEEDISEIFEISYPVARPASLCFIKDNNLVVKTIVVETETDIPLLLMEQEHIQEQYRNSEGISYMLLVIIRDEKYLGKIGRLGLNVPHKIALLEGPLTEKPVITYYGK